MNYSNKKNKKITEDLEGYTIINKIGEGGMGEVFLAVDNKLGLKVAIKLLPPELILAAELIEKFKQETEVLKSLIHANISAFFNFFEEQNYSYVVLEYVQGKTLKEIIKQTGAIEEKRALNIFRQMLEGIGFAHQKGIIHCNLKPENIMLDFKDNVKIMDFGLAKIPGNRVTIKTAINMGTLYYLSPEQIKAEKNIDRRSDIYSLGTILYEMLTGTVPFNTNVESDYEIMNEIVTGRVFNPRKIKPEISEQTALVIRKMMNKEKEKRYSTCCQCGVHLSIRKDKIPTEPICKPQPQLKTRKLKNFTEPEMILVDTGSFNREISNVFAVEKITRLVNLDSFYIGKYPVTQQEWIEIMGNNPSNFKGYNLPVELVSWNDIQIFIEKMNTKTGKYFYLPTEAEWEYAARGGNKSEKFIYSGSNNIDKVAWYSGNSENKTHPVGKKKPNELGIYDMTGNVWEWCYDWYDDTYYKNSPVHNPKGPDDGTDRILKGGSWLNYDDGCHTSNRSWDNPNNRNHYSGFRLARKV
ncbi:MAG: bifunctional serine/threonine-protein kinase/formylglycine-generating enzyme family protein [bacterium]